MLPSDTPMYPWQRIAMDYFQFERLVPKAERMVQTLERILEKNPDPTIVLLQYWSTPNLSGKCPAKLFMGHQLCTKIPQLRQFYVPYLVDHDAFCQWDMQNCSCIAHSYNKHRVNFTEESLTQGDRV